MGKTIRTTLVIPEELDRNTEAYRIIEDKGRSKNDIIKEALTKFLKEKGLQPDKMPKIKITQD